MAKKKSGTVLRYNRWGYIFLIPFVVVFIIFQLIPLISTIYNSFFEHYFKNGLTEVGPTFIGIQNYATLFSSGDLPKYLGNTMIMWIIGFIPQILLSLLLGAWFSDPSLRLKHQQFFNLLTELNHGICFCHVILYIVLRWWPDQLSVDADGHSE